LAAKGPVGRIGAAHPTLAPIDCLRL
jgi:hypothetical protein